MDKMKVLVVEDDLIVGAFFKACLENKGFNVIGPVITGEEAVNIAVDENPDLILMDIILDGLMDGIETAEEIKSNFNIPIIYATGNSDHRTLKRAMNTYPFEILIKPVMYDKLISTVKRALNVKCSKELQMVKELQVMNEYE